MRVCSYLLAYLNIYFSRDRGPVWCSACGDASGSGAVHPWRLRSFKVSKTANPLWTTASSCAQSQGRFPDDSRGSFLQGDCWGHPSTASTRRHVQYGKVCVSIYVNYKEPLTIRYFFILSKIYRYLTK